MIIVSQDKRMIINFDNIVGIVIRKNTDENLYQVQCKSENEKNKRILGKYKTEERAKEVLQEIMKRYLEIKCFYNSKYEVMQAIEQPKVYEMPVEKVDDK